MSSNESKIVTIKEASRILGVTPLTLRNWDNKGKLKALRHPINNYRVYKREDIDRLIEEIGRNESPTRSKSSKKAVRKLQVKHLNQD
jgi:predicted site-specific integrase-resolvase